MDEATPRQKFLLETRERIAASFRQRYGSAHAADVSSANVYPYFIGVFDTVAALGNPATFTLFSLVALAGAALTAGVVQALVGFGMFDGVLAHLTFWNMFIGMVVTAVATALVVYVYTHLKWDFKVEGYGWRDRFKTIHFNELWMQFYDTELHPNVEYARHAISIDENRADFARVAWSSKRGTGRDANGIQWFEQVWFAGNHSDIGGSYPENESRLSDISLDWMARWASAVPDGLKFDKSVLKVWPQPGGPQHDEVAAGFASVPRWTGVTWKEKYRVLPGPGAIMHASVYRRFDNREVRLTDAFGRYRPSTLETHDDFKRFYDPTAPFPANSYNEASALAGEPPPMV